MNFGHFQWENAKCKALLSDGTEKEITADLECDAYFAHWYEKICNEYDYFEEWWDINPIPDSVETFNSDEYIQEINNLPPNVSVVKIVDYNDASGYMWELVK